MASSGPIARCFVESESGWDREGLELGFTWLFDQVKENDWSSVGLAVASKKQIKELRPILGDSDTKFILQNGRMNVNSIDIFLLLERSLPWSFTNGPILTIWPRLTFLSKLDDLSPTALAGVSWIPGELDPWKETWGSTDLRTGNDFPLLEISNPVVKAGMAHLVQDCDDLRSPLAHPLDRGRAIGLFELLKNGNEPFDPREVAAFATRHGWASSDALPLQEIAEDVKDGRPLRGAQSWNRTALEQLRSEAEDAGGK